MVSLTLVSRHCAALTHPELVRALRRTRQLVAAGGGEERELAHATAVEAWAGGDLRKATAVWEAWLLRFPRDLLALRASHEAHLALGEPRAALESIARVRPMWDSKVFGYSQVLSMHALAIAESQAHHGHVAAEAEEMATAARNADKRDAWALHALCQIYTLQGRASEGASLLREHRDWWEGLPELQAALRFGAHLARFYLERGNYKAAMRTVDTAVCEPLEGVGVRKELGLVPKDEHVGDDDRIAGSGDRALLGDEKVLRAPPPAALSEATALLWLMELQGLPMAFRWSRVEKHWQLVAPQLEEEEERGGDQTDGPERLTPVMLVHRITPLEAVSRAMSKVVATELKHALFEDDDEKEADDVTPVHFLSTGMDGGRESAVDDDNATAGHVHTGLSDDDDFDLELEEEGGGGHHRGSSSLNETDDPIKSFLPVHVLGQQTRNNTVGLDWLLDDEPPLAPAPPCAPFRAAAPTATLSDGEVGALMAQSVAEGAVAFWRRDFEATIDLLMRLKPHLAQLGGSTLEQEIVVRTLIEATVRSEPHLMLARSLLAERTAMRTGSSQTWLRYADVLGRLNDEIGMDLALRHAYVMGHNQGGAGAH
uniref:Tetratricopeptide repeat protein 38 n=1 Tax=Octactis speculum TaxID=3111310 RepID=A0A7S2GFB6_9STRA|mmetsp:Transcript_46644/g.63507  ORF Transcript_46644/g.63507 Transcript_46644/m.63507 type:complete len:599 (+) Transcript_46644:503-2299(+)